MSTALLSDEVMPLGVDDIQLWLPSNEDQLDSTMPLAWCLSPELRDQLVSIGAEDAKLLIVVTNGLKETGRYLAPILAGRTYVAFRYPGLNTVHAVAVWTDRFDDSDSKFRAKDYLKRNPDGTYRHSLMEPIDLELQALRETAAARSSTVMHQKSSISMLKRRLLPPAQDPERPQIASPADIERWEIDVEMARLVRRMHELDNGEPEEIEAEIEGAEEDLAAMLSDALAADEAVAARVATTERVMLFPKNLPVKRSKSVGELDVMIPETMFARAWRGSALASILPTLLTATPRSIQPRMLRTFSISAMEYRRCPLSVRVG